MYITFVLVFLPSFFELSILDLLQMRQITMHLGEGFNNFWIEKIEEDLVEQP